MVVIVTVGKIRNKRYLLVPKLVTMLSRQEKLQRSSGKVFGGVVANVLNCDIIVNKFKLQSCYYIHFQTNTLRKGMNPLIPLLDCNIIVSEFKLQSCYYIHFQTNTLRKGMNLFKPTNHVLNGNTVFLKEWLWHQITHKGWCAINKRNQTKV